MKTWHIIVIAVVAYFAWTRVIRPRIAAASAARPADAPVAGANYGAPLGTPPTIGNAASTLSPDQARQQRGAI